MATSFTYTLVDLCRASGTITAGISTGLLVSFPLILIPAVNSANPLSPQNRLLMWSKCYDPQPDPMPFFVVLPSLSFLLAAGLLPSSTRRLVLATCGLTSLTIVPWSIIVVAPMLERLKANDKQADAEPAAVLKEKAGLLKTWTRMHAVRIALMGAAFVAGVAEILAY